MSKKEQTYKGIVHQPSPLTQGGYFGISSIAMSNTLTIDPSVYKNIALCVDSKPSLNITHEVKDGKTRLYVDVQPGVTDLEVIVRPGDITTPIALHIEPSE